MHLPPTNKPKDPTTAIAIAAIVIGTIGVTGVLVSLAGQYLYAKKISKIGTQDFNKVIIPSQSTETA